MTASACLICSEIGKKYSFPYQTKNSLAIIKQEKEYHTLDTTDFKKSDNHRKKNI